MIFKNVDYQVLKLLELVQRILMDEFSRKLLVEDLS